MKLVFVTKIDKAISHAYRLFITGKYQDEFFVMTYDLAIMFPMIEMARTHHRFIPEVLVDYNNDNPLSDHRVGKGLQRKLDLIIRARSCYSELASPF